jgi:predicted  nucleic acid-binding Zn-ribbon protein
MRIACVLVFILGAIACAASKAPAAECSCEQKIADTNAEEAERRGAVEKEKEALVAKNAHLEATKAALDKEVAELRAQIVALERFPDHAATVKQFDALKAEQDRLEQASDDLEAKMPEVQDERARLLEEAAALEAKLRENEARDQSRP